MERSGIDSSGRFVIVKLARTRFRRPLHADPAADGIPAVAHSPDGRYLAAASILTPGVGPLLTTVDLCYCETVKNITVSVPDDVYRSARVKAAEEGTSVSAMVAAYLDSLSDDRAEFERLDEQQKRIVAQIDHFRASDRVDREELHDRAIR